MDRFVRPVILFLWPVLVVKCRCSSVLTAWTKWQKNKFKYLGYSDPGLTLDCFLYAILSPFWHILVAKCRSSPLSRVWVNKKRKTHVSWPIRFWSAIGSFRLFVISSFYLWLILVVRCQKRKMNEPKYLRRSDSGLPFDRFACPIFFSLWLILVVKSKKKKEIHISWLFSFCSATGSLFLSNASFSPAQLGGKVHYSSLSCVWVKW